MAVVQTRLHFTSRGESHARLPGTWQRILTGPRAFAGLMSYPSIRMKKTRISTGSGTPFIQPLGRGLQNPFLPEALKNAQHKHREYGGDYVIDHDSKTTTHLPIELADRPRLEDIKKAKQQKCRQQPGPLQRYECS